MGKPSIQAARKKEEVIMISESIPVCGEHQIPREWRPTTFECGEDGVSIRVPNIHAWVCPQDGEASFTPETTDELIVTVREMIEPAKHARERRSMPTEYIVSIG